MNDEENDIIVLEHYGVFLCCLLICLIPLVTLSIVSSVDFGSSHIWPDIVGEYGNSNWATYTIWCIIAVFMCILVGALITFLVGFFIGVPSAFVLYMIVLLFAKIFKIKLARNGD